MTKTLEESTATGGAASGVGGQTGDGDGDVVGTGGGTVDGSGGSPIVGSGGGNTGGTGGVSEGTGGVVVSNCTNNLPTGTDWPEADCQMWADSGNCDQQWFIDQNACEESCGRCSAGSGGTPGDGDGDGDGDTGGTGGSYGDLTLPPLEGGTNGWATRYWDCCKPSCSWTANASNPVDSCDINDNNIGVDDGASNGCQGGPAFTCHNWAPWAKSDTVSYGFVAYNGAPCGTCFQVQFEGTSHNGQATPGIAGKQMIVQVTNIGGLQTNQLDILVPGGGVGDFNGCSTQWGVSNNQLGEQWGGFRATCGADATCIRNMCENAFGDSSELMAGCEWYINWYQMADNPNLRYKQVDCPQEILDRSGG